MNAASGALRAFVGLAWRAATLLALCGVWLGSLGIGGIIAYRQFFHFDALDWSNWVDIRRLYLSGATIPFDFAAIAAGLPVLGMIGCVVLAMRCGRLGDRLRGSWRPLGFFPSGFVSSAFHRRRRRGRRPEPQAVKDVLGMIGRSAHSFWPLLRRFIGRGRSERRKSPETDAVEIRAVETRGAAAAPPAEEPVAATASPGIGDPAGNAERPVAGATSLADSIGRSPPSPIDMAPRPGPAASADAAPSAAEPIDEDYAVFGRIMALFEVWSDPAPEWMRAALREEIDRLSEAGWGLFADFGDPAAACLETVAAAGLLPSAPGKRAVARALLEGRRKRDVPDEGLAEETEPGPPGTALADDAPPPPIEAARLSMSAAWLCEMVDNFVMLEEIRAAGAAEGALSFENRWGAIYRETGERLKLAMQTMSEPDWRSIDQFPDRAGRIRILTDRLREDLRFLPAAAPPAAADSDRPFSGEPPAPARPPVPAISVSPPGAADDGAAVETAPPPLEEILRAAGYIVRPLPALRGPASDGTADYLAQRDDFTVLLRLADLSGGDWTMDGDSLAPWRGGAGHALPSPCRAVWQRLALMRSLDRETKPCAGVVVLRGGHFTDEQAVASIVARDRRRTDVDVAWLDRASSTLPDLPAWLVRMAASRSKADGVA